MQWLDTLKINFSKSNTSFFLSVANVYNDSKKMDTNLGTEIDITVAYTLTKDITISTGYSKILATETMEILKGGEK